VTIFEIETALIAGTALARGLTVVARITRFDRVGVEYLNPWSNS
jgi:predicted nucleic acid-binding protein